MEPVEAPATGKGTRTDLGKVGVGTKLAPNPRDPLYFETATTLAVDFHSFRRAFNTALAEAGVNVQHAMHLASHADAKVHARYVMSTKAMRTIPSAALPRLPTEALLDVSKTTETAGIVIARDDSTPTAPLAYAQLRDILVGTTGFEPATPTVSRRQQALLRGTGSYFSRGIRYRGVLERPARFAQVVCKVVCICMPGATSWSARERPRGAGYRSRWLKSRNARSTRFMNARPPGVWSSESVG
jgi:hypothetical protein